MVNIVDIAGSNENYKEALEDRMTKAASGKYL